MKYIFRCPDATKLQNDADFVGVLFSSDPFAAAYRDIGAPAVNRLISKGKNTNSYTQKGDADGSDGPNNLYKFKLSSDKASTLNMYVIKSSEAESLVILEKIDAKQKDDPSFIVLKGEDHDLRLSAFALPIKDLRQQIQTFYKAAAEHINNRANTYHAGISALAVKGEPVTRNYLEDLFGDVVPELKRPQEQKKLCFNPQTAAPYSQYIY